MKVVRRVITRSVVDEAWLYRTLGSRVRTARKKRGLSQQELATALGLSRASVANLEAGNQKCSLRSVYDAALALRVTPKELMP